MKNIFLASLFILTFPFLAKAEGFDFYVDKNHAGQELGTIEKPFRTIAKAISKAEQNRPGLRRIFVGDGEYAENFILSPSIKLIGQNKDNTIIKISESSSLDMQGNNIVENLTFSGGVSALTIHGAATIKNCIIKNARKKGVDLPEGNSLVKISNSSIVENGGKGVYVQKGRTILLENNVVANNRGEGFDIRQNIFGVVTGNEITSNTESGIEILTSASDVVIRNNVIKNNLANGIANQSYPDMPDLGKINIRDNILTGNGKYGIYCGAPSGGVKTKTFFSESIFLDSNENVGNIGKPVSGSCHLERQTSEFIQKISSDIEKSTILQSDQQGFFYDIENDFDSHLASSEKVAQEIESMSLFKKIFFGISVQKIDLLYSNNLQLSTLIAKATSLLDEYESDELRDSTSLLIKSSNETIAFNDALIGKSEKTNIILWLPIKIAGIFR
ncbi:MAG: hypothetical protein ACD_56C00136G0007 [uncultured bacterium]|nr:MAG: hypothetical protein ACD_56C00136G0007 [uncultured bacterium]